MVHHHHAVLSILIIVHYRFNHIINNMVQQIQRQVIKQHQQVVLVEFIDVNRFCINAIVTMIFHQTVSRAIRPSDLNCKYLVVRIYSIDKKLRKEGKGEKKRKEKKETRFSFSILALIFCFLFFSCFLRSFFRLSLVANCTPSSRGARVYASDSLLATHFEPSICRAIDE